MAIGQLSGAVASFAFRSGLGIWVKPEGSGGGSMDVSFPFQPAPPFPAGLSKKDEREINRRGRS